MWEKLNPKRTVTIYRSDFNGHKDSGSKEYFDYILGQLGIPENKQKEIDKITLSVSRYQK
jgi:hypothetical protein